MSLANPVYLWSLLGLAIPIAIHLLSRKEGRVIKLGSIRHVQETSTQQFRGIKLNEILLLTLRCLLIAMLALGISGFYFSHENGQWILLEPGVEKNKNIQAAIDSLEEQGYESRWLAQAFPTIGNSPDSSFSNYWFAIRQLEKHNLKDAIIFTFTKAEKFKGRQQSISDNIKVVPVEPETKRFVLEAVQADDSVSMRVGISNSMSTVFQNQTVISVDDSVRIISHRENKILIVRDKSHEKEVQILIAAVHAIDKITPHQFLVSEKSKDQFTTTDNPNWVFWLTNETAPIVKSKLLKWNPTFTHNLIEQSGKNEWSLTQHLNEEVAIERNLTLSLATLLTSDSAIQNTSSSNDQRMLPESMAWTSGAKKSSSAAVAQPFSLPLYGLFSLLLLIERYLSYRKNQ